MAAKNSTRVRPHYIPNHIPDPSYVRILDTTLRDGEQAPGAAMTSTQKLAIARQLAKLGVDVIDAGFPSASQEDFNAVKMIAQEVGNEVYDDDGYVPVITGLCRCDEKDIKTAWEAVKYAKRPRLLTFIATSPIHMEYKLRKSKDQVLQIARDMVKFARSLCSDVTFGAEDSARSDREFLYQILGEVIKAGATTVGIGDTVGIALPFEFAKLVADVKANTPGIENVIISVHCHNDLGHATANTIEAARVGGARQLEVTMNGIGERAGNASFEEVVMALKCRGDYVLDGLYTGINTRHILKTSKMVEEYSGMHLQPHKAVVGANAFVHESGIHQAGMLKHRSTYEILSPEDIGHEKSNLANIVLGRLSGREALKMRLKELGYEFKDDEVLESVFWNFKAIAEKKKRVTDVDLKALVSNEGSQAKPIWKLGDLQVTCGTMGFSTSIVKLVTTDGNTHVACSNGKGIVDSAYKAIDLIVKEPVKIVDYSLTTGKKGIDASTTTSVVISRDNHTPIPTLNGDNVYPTFSGTGEGLDVVVSSVEAYLIALNKMLGFKESFTVSERIQELD